MNGAEPVNAPAETSPSRAWVGITFALLSAIALSWKAIFAKLAYRAGVDATTVLGLRMAFSLPAFLWLAWLGARRQPLALSRRDWIAVATLGLVGYYVASYLDFIGLTRISAGLERLILFLYPSIVVVLAATLARRRIAAREWQAMLLGYGGIAFVFAGDASRSPHGSAAWIGVGFVFASSIAYAAYLVFAERFMIRLGSIRFTGLAMSFACLFGLLQLVIVSVAQARTAPPLDAVLICALMAYVSTVVPTLLLSEAVRRIGSGRAALYGMVGPVATVGLEVVLLGEHAGWQDAVGTALVIGSVVLLTRKRALPVEAEVSSALPPAR